ncbi:DUF58 domain-containing protein [Haloarcula pellucida]|uniref:DUF58 domain-containing protein n=1 Tax=Haloarcula pellucida TaxID=1427151 RepID=A0A830GGH9_9EURY|nr:DUF58 domain-containing protein [Halomicroarcula pellucida]MBX0347063.1 DUF58 domain-containing protein [Halomicroarcula pellucida]GGN86801.1 DUF58 domain-containing protein [Halomicroarcula pellucida]
MTERRRARRAVGLSVALVTGAVGLVTGNAAIFVASTVGLVYAAYESATRRPEPELTVERTLEPATPLPGDEVTVTVTVHNHGRSYLPDVRIVDGVPERLRVVEGAPRFGTTLDADDSDSFSYTVRARRGEHPFGETTVVCHDLAGTEECRESVTVETTIDCSADVESIPLSAQMLQRTGRTRTQAGGDGVSFYGIREYQSADPMRRIDWNRFARTSELATVEYQETAAATVVLLLDTRHPVAPRPRDPNAVQFCTYAAEQLARTLLAENDRVGAATFDDCAYLRPSGDRSQYRRLCEFLAAESGDDAVASEFLEEASGRHRFQSFADVASADPVADGGDPVGMLDRRFPDEAQVVFCSPLLDDRAAGAAKRLAAYGHDVTVVSPDVTASETPGGALAGFDRSERIDDLRGTVRVADWTLTDPLAKTLVRATERWSA